MLLTQSFHINQYSAGLPSGAYKFSDVGETSAEPESAKIFKKDYRVTKIANSVRHCCYLIVFSAQRVGFFNIGSGRVGYWTKYRVAGRVRVG